MWIFLNSAFLSVVAHRERQDSLLVRARIKGDIERVFPNAQITSTPHADYAYRAVVDRDEVAERIAREVRGIDYFNFKDSVPTKQHERHDAYMRVWGTMRDFQKQVQREKASGR